jgi:hypothetical protein
MSQVLSPQEISDFIRKFVTSPEKVLVVFHDIPSGIGFSVIGKFKVLEGGPIIVQGEGDPTITESSGFTTTVANLYRFPCAFMDPRDFKAATAFLRDEIGIDFGLKFSIPDRVFSIMLLKESS